MKSGHWGSCIEHISANAGFHQLSCRAEVWFPKRDSSFLLSPGSPWRVRLPWFCTWASSLGPSAHLSSQEGQLVNPLGAGCVVFSPDSKYVLFVQQPILQFSETECPTTTQFSSDTHYPELAQTPQMKGSLP